MKVLNHTKTHLELVISVPDFHHTQVHFAPIVVLQARLVVHDVQLGAARLTHAQTLHALQLGLVAHLALQLALRPLQLLHLLSLNKKIKITMS